jgi:hypothetical protein
MTLLLELLRVGAFASFLAMAVTTQFLPMQ